MSSALSRAEQAINRFAVRATYRNLLRATRIAFAGDEHTLGAARLHAREQFRAKKHEVSGSIEASQALEHAQGVTQILRENLVQGKNVGGDQYKLNIHEHTQRLDNDTAGQLKGTKKSFKEIKDSVF
ncbi:Mitochondrial zinc maintenance 1, mitochondrial [Lecanosticta acicola]|uniref:Mitochondrial zinc maintenance protein 1, mitochondrial n=1 Tax=Lecanosticta acicola TaxID=111012 RepID=A0AAI9E7L9_9PEZI|nr:Mitochondrial zinc maintenance 1, mitochondrial [Lecanosticta acicola]